MKKLTYIISIALLAGLAAGCSKFTDVKPKGTNTLEEVSDLDQVLNYRFASYNYEYRDAMSLVNDMMPDCKNILDLITGDKVDMYKVVFMYDEVTDRAELTDKDRHYEEFYSVINTVANPVLLRADKANGDRALANRLKAEAYVLRAYFHFLAVNFYARAYDPATAATDPGVPFIDEHDVVNSPAVKLSVKEVYDRILSDLDAALELGTLHDTPRNKMRVSKPLALGVKAQVLLTMRDYKGALKAAEDALKIHSVINDYHDQLPPEGSSSQVKFARPEMQFEEDIFYVSYSQLFGAAFTPQLAAVFEPGNILMDIYPRGADYGHRFYKIPELECFAYAGVFSTTRACLQ